MNLDDLTLIRDFEEESSDYLGHGNSPAARVVATWHDENHAGAYTMCQEQPCSAVRRVDE